MPGNKPNDSLPTRREILWKGLLTPLGKVVTAGSSIAWLLALLRDTLMSLKWRHLLAAIPNWWAHAWLAIFSISFAVVVVEGSLRVTRKKALQYLNEIEKLKPRKISLDFNLDSEPVASFPMEMEAAYTTLTIQVPK